MIRGNLLSLRAAGPSGDSIAFVHPAGGSAGGFRRLLPHLPPGPGVLAFEADADAPADRCSIGAIAADYLEELAPQADLRRTVLVGWSLGGAVAVEMARLSEQAGAAPRAVLLLDSATPAVLGVRPRRPAAEIAALFGVAEPDLPADADDAQILAAVARALEERSPGAGFTPADLEPYAATYRWHLRAARAEFTVRPCAAPVVLVRALDESGWGDAPQDLGWSAVFGRAVPQRWTPGTHHTLLDPAHVAAAAALIEDCIPTERVGG
ncbi:thioesterase domain-containing protein [Streptomyces sp. 1114.5]|uniref:alpha/beta fold hydrolase n=1 Tax=unclassified Streptomyces TaxID=2593676 RepID=UPI000BD9363F|nr:MULTISPECIES: alpha/beta fold hydrolase [unclassified Streptomyces]RKT11414.1 thioesterase domain-containing protein [Streptomyces sp. 1114.5]SOB81219.1 Thioesterase domain-containing protein [Streptomyces sp. 1331.2]